MEYAYKDLSTIDKTKIEIFSGTMEPTDPAEKLVKVDDEI